MADVAHEQVRFREVQRYSRRRVLAPLVLIACVGAWVAVVLGLAADAAGGPPVWPPRSTLYATAERGRLAP